MSAVHAGREITSNYESKTILKAQVAAASEQENPERCHRVAVTRNWQLTRTTRRSMIGNGGKPRLRK